MLQTFARATYRSQLTVLRAASFATTTKKTTEKASGDEKNYINKQEEKLLKNLLKKVKEQTLPEEKKAEVCEKEVRETLKKFDVKITDSLVKDLLSWKADKWEQYQNRAFSDDLVIKAILNH